MRIEDAWSTTAVELEVVGYQFPDLAPQRSGFDWDANWLQVHGTVSSAKASWSFTDPCMTTQEAAELSEWLGAVAAGDAELTENVFVRGGAISFTEPNVSARFAARDRSTRSLVWYFSQESSPPGSSDDIRFGIGHPVELVVTARDLAVAAQDWNAALTKFPRRDV
jgi:hypothetical protein